MSKDKREVWAADFETTTNPLDCRVWAWGIANVNKAKTAADVLMGNTLAGFIDFVSKTSSIVYFHNLAFDARFILDWIFRSGYTLSTEKKLAKNTFSVLINHMGAFYSVTVCWANGKRTEFRDSLKKLPMKVSRIAKAFKLAEEKGTLDYKTFRAVGHELTEDEKAYLASDVIIIAMALKLQFDNGLDRLTVGADALNEYKQLMTMNHFNRFFPVLSEAMDRDIRQAYRGGFTLAPKKYQGKRTRSGRVYDVNSLYPAVMYKEILPYGEPRWVDGLPVKDKTYNLFIVSITFTAKLKKDHIPCIQIKNNLRFSSTEYQEKITDPVTLMVTNVDLALWQEHYHLNILSYNGGWQFTGANGFFNEYIDKWMSIKANSSGGMRELAKLQLNSLYGKFAKNPNVTGKIPVFEDNIVKLKLGPEETTDPCYTAMGVFITAYAREITIRAAQQHYDDFAYADTDSLHLLIDEDPLTLDIDPHKMGAWKFEYAFDEALFVRAKCYTERVTGDAHTAENCPMEQLATPVAHGPHCNHVTHIAGAPENIVNRMDFDSFFEGNQLDGKLVPKTVPGGIVLTETTFTMHL